MQSGGCDEHALFRQKEAKGKLDAEFVTEKTEQVRIRRMQTEMAVAKARGELVERSLVEKQAAFLFVALRQKILSTPQTYCRRLLGISDAKVMNAKLKEMSLSMLEELRNLPERVTDPNWLDTLEKDDGGK